METKYPLVVLKYPMFKAMVRQSALLSEFLSTLQTDPVQPTIFKAKLQISIKAISSRYWLNVQNFRTRRIGSNLGSAYRQCSGATRPFDWNQIQRSKWRFTCDSNDNGEADENESFLTEWIKNGDFSKIVVNCGDLDNCLGCLDSEIKWVLNNKESLETICFPALISMLRCYEKSYLIFQDN